MRRVLVLACLMPTAARAAPSMLNQIPITDLVPVGQVSLQLQNGNTEVSGRSSVFHQPQLVPQSEFGLPGNIEAGLDVAPSDPPHDYRPEMNVKWNPVREDYHIPAVALGAMQLGVGFTPNYFLVLSKTLNYQQIQYQKLWGLGDFPLWLRGVTYPYRLLLPFCYQSPGHPPAPASCGPHT